MAKCCSLNYSIFLVYLENLGSNGYGVRGIRSLRIVLLIRGCNKFGQWFFLWGLYPLTFLRTSCFLGLKGNLNVLKD